MKGDGTRRRKITPEPILDIFAVSPDGRWVVLLHPEAPTKITPLRSERLQWMEVRRCRYASVGAISGGIRVESPLIFSFQVSLRNSNSIPVIHDLGLPKIPPAGLTGIEDIPNAKTNAAIPRFVESAVSRSVYAYSRVNTRRNLYRIQLP